MYSVSRAGPRDTDRGGPQHGNWVLDGVFKPLLVETLRQQMMKVQQARNLIAAVGDGQQGDLVSLHEFKRRVGQNFFADR